MSSCIRPACIFLASLMIALLILGWQGTERQKQLRKEVEGQATIAFQLESLREAAQAEGQNSLLLALDDSLNQLAPAARGQIKAPSPEPLPQQLHTSVNALVKFGVETASSADRARALTAVTRIWAVARTQGITQEKYPTALADKLAELESYSCTEPVGETPQPSSAVKRLQDTLYQLKYVSEFYAARAGNGYSAVAPRAQELARQSTVLVNTLTPLLICQHRLEAVEPSYPTATPEQAQGQLNDLSTALRDNSLAVICDPAVSSKEDSLEIMALVLALAFQPLP